MGSCLAVEGSTTRKIFEIYLERILAPSLRPGQIVVMDNLSSHKGEKVRKLIEGRGSEAVTFSTCRPTHPITPIEEAFAKLKSLLREARAHPRNPVGSDG